MVKFVEHTHMIHFSLQEVEKAASAASEVQELQRKLSQVEEDNIVLVRSLRKSQDMDDVKVSEYKSKVDDLEKDKEQMKGQVSNIGI